VACRKRRRLALPTCSILIGPKKASHPQQISTTLRKERCGGAPVCCPAMPKARARRARSLTDGRIPIECKCAAREAAHFVYSALRSCRTISPGSWPGVFPAIRALTCSPANPPRAGKSRRGTMRMSARMGSAQREAVPAPQRGHGGEAVIRPRPEGALRHSCFITDHRRGRARREFPPVTSLCASRPGLRAR
jgi:hypothetical protein